MEQSESKQLILDEAIRLFAAKGYDAIGISEICEKTNFTKPTLYYYFGSKAGIIKSISEYKGEEFIQILSEAALYEHDFQKSISKLYRTVIAYAKENPDFFRLHCVLINGPKASEGTSEYEITGNKVYELLKEFINNSCNEIGNMRGKEELYSVLLCNNLHSVALYSLNNTEITDDDTINKIVHSFIYGVVS